MNKLLEDQYLVKGVKELCNVNKRASNPLCFDAIAAANKQCDCNNRYEMTPNCISEIMNACFPEKVETTETTVNGVKIGSAVGGVLGLCVVALNIFFICYWMKRRKPSSPIYTDSPYMAEPQYSDPPKPEVSPYETIPIEYTEIIMKEKRPKINEPNPYDNPAGCLDSTPDGSGYDGQPNSAIRSKVLNESGIQNAPAIIGNPYSNLVNEL